MCYVIYTLQIKLKWTHPIIGNHSLFHCNVYTKYRFPIKDLKIGSFCVRHCIINMLSRVSDKFRSGGMVKKGWIVYLNLSLKLYLLCSFLVGNTEYKLMT